MLTALAIIGPLVVIPLLLLTAGIASGYRREGLRREANEVVARYEAAWRGQFSRLKPGETLPSSRGPKAPYDRRLRGTIVDTNGWRSAARNRVLADFPDIRALTAGYERRREDGEWPLTKELAERRAWAKEEGRFTTRGRDLGVIARSEVVYVATRRIPEGILWKIGKTTQNPVTRVRQFGGELVGYTDEISEARAHRLLASSRVTRRDLPAAIGRDAAPTEWFYGTDEVLAFAYDGKLPSGETVRMLSNVSAPLHGAA